MAVYQVENDAEFAAAIANPALLGTDTIELANGAAFGTLIVPSSTVDGITIASQSKWGCTAARFRLQAVEGVNFHDTYIQSIETDFTTKPAPLLDFNSPSMNGFVMMGCKVRHGNHLASFANFDPTNAGEQYAAQIGSGSTATWPVPNQFGRWSATYTTGIMDAVQPTNGALNGSIWIEDCDFEDNSYIFQLTHNGGAAIVIRKNRFQRSYGDVILIGYNASFDQIPLLEITGNVIHDCAWCQPQDAGNPHGDAIQINSSDTGGVGDSDMPIENVLIAGNIISCSAGYRGQIQRPFLSDVPDGYPFIGPIIHENLCISRISSVGVVVANGNTTSDPPPRGGAFAFVNSNTILARPDRNTPVQNEAYTNPNTGIVPASPSAARIAITQDAAYPGRSLIGNNFTESMLQSAMVDTASMPNIVTGKPDDGNDFSTWFDVPANWNAVNTPEQVFAAFMPKPAYGDYGAVRQGQTFQQFLDKWSGDVKPYSELPSFVGFKNTKDIAVLDTPTVSEPSFIHAGYSTRTLSVNAGTEWCVTDNKDDVPAVWSTATGPYAVHGKWLHLRRNSPADAGGTSTATVTIGSDTFLWRLYALENINFPVLAFSGTQLFRQVSLQGLDAAEGKQLLLLLVFKLAGHPVSAVDLLRNASGTARTTFQILTTGKMRTILRNNVGTGLVSFDTIKDVADGNIHRILIAVDMAQAVSTDGVVMYVDDEFEAIAPSGYTQNGLIDFDFATTHYQVGGSTSTPSYVYEHSAMWYGANQWLDIHDEENREKFRASKIGSTGKGPTGTAPRVVLVATAAQANAGDFNKGTGVEWPKLSGIGADITQVGTDPWPPVLTLEAVATPGPYIVGAPISFFVSANGYPDANIITGAANLAGTWVDNTVDMPEGSNGIFLDFTPSATGLYTFTFTSDSATYVDPDPIALTVEAAPVPPVLEDGIKRAIKHGIKRTIKRSMRDWS